METTKFLLDHGADVNLENGEGETPLLIAVASQNVPLIKLLLSRGADSRVWAARAISIAAQCRNTEIFHILLASVADLDTADGLETALLEILDEGRLDSMPMLLDIRDPDIPLTQRTTEKLMSTVLVANKVLGMIIDRKVEDVAMTLDMLETAMQGVHDMDSLRIILKAQTVFQFTLTKELVVTAANISSVETMRLLLKQCAEHGVITSNTLKRAVLNQPGQRAGMFQLRKRNSNRRSGA